MKAALVIMAAGMGSRYGGNKQVDGIGPNGEILMEYSIFDALRAGFTKVVFIIKPDMRDLMENMVGKHLAACKTADGDNVEVCYAYQDFSSVPNFYKVPSERVKPFGTVHALLCAREFVHEPFVVINADDYYGVDAFKTIYTELSKLAESGEGTMVGYDLCNTVSEHGTVTRGVCHVNEQGMLEARIAEITRILGEATVVATPKRSNSVHIGSTVTVDMGGRERVFTIVGGAESDAHEGKISNESPVGQALLGCKKGDEVTTTGPTGRDIKLTVIKIEH